MCQVAEPATLDRLVGEDDLIPEGQSKLLGTDRMTLATAYKGLVGADTASTSHSGRYG